MVRSTLLCRLFWGPFGRISKFNANVVEINMQRLLSKEIFFSWSVRFQNCILRYLMMQIRGGMNENYEILMFHFRVFLPMWQHFCGIPPKLKILSKMTSEVCLVMFLVKNGAQHSPLSFVQVGPKGKFPSSTQMYVSKISQCYMSMILKETLKMNISSKFFSI